MNRVLAVLSLALLTSCSHTDPLEVGSVTSAPRAAPFSDQAVIAAVVGTGEVGTYALAWANPDTGSAGVIERIDPANGVANGCRKFVTSQQSLEGETRFDGIVCPSGNAWRLSSGT
ncbi:RT0821/Lpp0805 family surface protein [Rhizobium sp. BK379]|jgi:hypothetical protein|uniref:RT0821/Lpp0805 family surface protein n=1 Tax=Rhizobium sp. BK379 TaxID=2587059 RepID=UPI000DDB00AC|nr:RT0821/Lpp0805 family surface protein [Rhizobium sp. BK379]MBB3444073.1 hypothetical protein [Rhizobium sp. BK379]